MRTKNVLVVLQPSVIDYEKKVYSHRDSGVSIEYWIQTFIGPKYNWVTMVPKSNEGYSSWFNKTGVAYEWDYPLDLMKVRLEIDIHQIPKAAYSIIRNNIPERAPAIKELYHDVPLVYANYFVDTPTHPKSAGKLYPLQLNGALASDILTFTTEIIREDFLASAPEGVRKVLENKPTYILDLGFPAKEIEDFDENSYNFKYKYDEELPIVFFPNRITKPDYTNFEVFAKAIMEIEKKYPDLKFNLFIANPTGKYYTPEDFSKMFRNYIPTKGLEREEYLYLIKKAHCVVTLFLDELYGGCANVESIYAGAYPIMPKINEYKNRAPEDYPFFVKPDLSDLAEIIYNCIKTPKDFSLIKWMKQNVYNRSSLEKAALIIDEIIRKHSI